MGTATDDTLTMFNMVNYIYMESKCEMKIEEMVNDSFGVVNGLR